MSEQETAQLITSQRRGSIVTRVGISWAYKELFANRDSTLRTSTPSAKEYKQFDLNFGVKFTKKWF